MYMLAYYVLVCKIFAGTRTLFEHREYPTHETRKIAAS